MLSGDIVRLIANGAEHAVKLACVCKDWRFAIEDGAGVAFDIRRSLLGIGETALQQDLVSALSLSPIHVKLAPHTRKRNRYGGFYHIYTREAALQLFRSHGGFGRLEKRRARRAKSCQRGALVL